MKTDKNKTDVRFLFHTENNDLFAYFLNEDYNFHLYGHSMKNSYTHIGQHSGCSVDYANECRAASPMEYAGLKSELESIGYNLNILNS